MRLNSIKLSGFKANVDIPIEYIGLRPGEKMFEELITKGENIIDSPHEKIMILKNQLKHGWNQTLAESEQIVNISKSYDTELIKKTLNSVVPEYVPNTQKNDNLDILIKKNQKI